jgi:hypothetical protein
VIFVPSCEKTVFNPKTVLTRSHEGTKKEQARAFDKGDGDDLRSRYGAGPEKFSGPVVFRILPA